MELQTAQAAMEAHEDAERRKVVEDDEGGETELEKELRKRRNKIEFQEDKAKKEEEEEEETPEWMVVTEIAEQIRMDLERCYPEGCEDHFMAPERQELMFGVLFVWARLHPATSYRQGMHELLALLLLVTEAESTLLTLQGHTPTPVRPEKEETPMCSPGPKRKASSDGPLAGLSPTKSRRDAESATELPLRITQPFLTIFNASWREADCFALFQRLMEQVEPLFASVASGGSVVRHGDSASSKAADREYGVKVALSPVLAMCFHVQGEKLEVADPQLHAHLLAEQVPPHIYMMKWLRLMYCREFDTSDVLQLWDTIFLSSEDASEPNILEWLELLAIVMIVNIREHLLSGDTMECLRLLLNYPVQPGIPTLLHYSRHQLENPTRALDVSQRDHNTTCLGLPVGKIFQRKGPSVDGALETPPPPPKRSSYDKMADGLTMLGMNEQLENLFCLRPSERQTLGDITAAHAEPSTVAAPPPPPLGGSAGLSSTEHMITKVRRHGDCGVSSG
mmetsp:Transcript_96365/g.274668  ORF Transcript_96365/g.274668 Transcript_96365/m.274668 type:complete len:508 (+) Transcript_96365:520-2043(+)